MPVWLTNLEGERLRLVVDGGGGDVCQTLVADRLVSQLSERLRLDAPVLGGVHEVQVLCRTRSQSHILHTRTVRRLCSLRALSLRAGTCKREAAGGRMLSKHYAQIDYPDVLCALGAILDDLTELY